LLFPWLCGASAGDALRLAVSRRRREHGGRRERAPGRRFRTGAGSEQRRGSAAASAASSARGAVGQPGACAHDAVALHRRARRGAGWHRQHSDVSGPRPAGAWPARRRSWPRRARGRPRLRDARARTACAGPTQAAGSLILATALFGKQGRDRAAVSAGDSNTAVTAGGEADAPVDSGLPAAGAAVEDGRRLRRPWAARPAVAGSDDDRMAAIVRREHRIARVGCLAAARAGGRRGCVRGGAAARAALFTWKLTRAAAHVLRATAAASSARAWARTTPAVRGSAAAAAAARGAGGCATPARAPAESALCLFPRRGR
jgi:hypothetical protein